MSLTVYRKAHFNAAHRLHNPAWDDQKNAAVFGKCSNPHYHGHNYELVVGITGDVDPQTGFVISIEDLKAVIKSEVEDAFDHKNLNLEVADFAELNPTAENIAICIYNRLRPHIKSDLDLEVTLYETPRNYVTYSG
ncbi:6-pyruvoyl trahydropterin synthase family protein [Gilvibacter sediminis]|uniref:6-pyruvoyl trahydropterin synthase family protein n=1 Tax=Gilvibacter sediminis TaxID=379071 RepID=UPI00235030C4|nr:6-carboxytetrahydropterin synthase [Gilvibacter sediminis]MDC7998782.1 6-carboxytetrahydropterin synthase [Gilvibacter sediminis]